MNKINILIFGLIFLIGVMPFINALSVNIPPAVSNGSYIINVNTNASSFWGNYLFSDYGL